MPTYLKFFSENRDAIVAIAALGALAMTALTAFLSLVGTVFAKRIEASIKMQESMRVFLEDGMIGLGENLHEIMANADILVQKFQLYSPSPNLEESIKNYKSKIDNNKKHLLKAKTSYRYKIYGLQEGIATIARAADWVKGLRKDIPRAKKILVHADKIRALLDKEILSCYRRGAFPRTIPRMRIKYHAWRVRQLWSKRSAA